MAINMEENRSLVRVSEDCLEAYLSLCPPQKGEEYELADLEALLKMNNVTEGINKETLLFMIREKEYYKEYLAAKGIPAVNGKDGSYEFLFNVVQDTRPKILPDGSVDYGKMKDVETVEAGDEIVRYKYAEAGSNGVDVYGKPILAKAGRDLPVLKGKGFILSQDKSVYTAAATGKVEFINERLTVTNMLTIEGDVTILTGNIKFNGDVLVRGNVVTGMTINAKGNITVDGHVEAAELTAGKDIVLKNGMQGSGRGEIRAGGDVSGKFFEQATIYAKGSIRANAILNCYMISEQEIIVSGKMGIIVGGRTCAIRRIDATIIGNMSEVRTRIELGVDEEVYVHLQKVKDKYETVSDEIHKLDMAIKQINRVLEKGNRPDLSEKKLTLLRMKVEKDTVINSLQEELRNTRAKIENSKGARLIVSKSIYRGAKIIINGTQKILESENYNVFYVKNGGEIDCKQNI